MHLFAWLTLSVVGVLAVNGAVSEGSGCNQTLKVTNQPHNITSDSLHSDSTSGVYCWWQLVSKNVEGRVRIDVIKSELAGDDPDCSNEYMAAYDGNSTSNRIIKKWCGKSLPRLISSNKRMFLVFRSNGSTSRRGFVITYYKETKFRCGGDMVVGSDVVTLHSPGYPANYPNNLICTWLVSAQNSNESVSLQPVLVDLQPSPVCEFDSVTVKYGSLSADKFCDSNHALKYVSPQSYMTITLITDATFTFQGFVFNLQSVPGRPSDCVYHLLANENTEIVTSPDHSTSLEEFLDCQWHIKTSTSGLKVQINFLNSTLQTSQNCQTESVMIYDGTTITSPGLGQFCGNATPIYTSSGQDMWVVFNFDPSKVRTGFRMSYKQVDHVPDTGCGVHTVELNASTSKSAITSPNFPKEYPKNADCSWRISSDDGTKVINLDVTDSDIQNFGDCIFDYVKVYDGYNESSKLLGRLCGNRNPTYQSSGPVLFIRFHSDGYNTGTGFRMQYSHPEMPKPKKGESSPTTGAIVGGVLGIVVLLGGVALLIRICGRKPSEISQASVQGIHYNTI